jgi:hypothetical protein
MGSCILSSQHFNQSLPAGRQEHFNSSSCFPLKIDIAHHPVDLAVIARNPKGDEACLPAGRQSR